MAEKKILNGQALFQIYFEEVLLRFALEEEVIDPIKIAKDYYLEALSNPEEFPKHYEQALTFMTAILQEKSPITKILKSEGVTYELGDELRGDLHSNQLKSEMIMPWVIFSFLPEEMQTSYLQALVGWFTAGTERPILPDIPRD